MQKQDRAQPLTSRTGGSMPLPRHYTILCALAILAVTASGAPAKEPMHGEITRYEGAKTCGECHDTAAKEVAESLHYQLRGESPFVEGGEKGKEAGFMVDFSPSTHTVAGVGWTETVKKVDDAKQELAEGCARCHAGSGAKPNPVGKLTEKDFLAVDCLVCHAPDYRKVIEKEGTILPARELDLLKAARDAQKPSAEMCLRCHAASSGAGPGRGILGGDNDIHFSFGMACTECHKGKKHKIAGGGHLRAQELPDVRLACENCHTGKPHKGDDAPQLNRHCYRIACQTCHMPAVAHDAATPVVTGIDWTTPKRNEKSGRYEPLIKEARRVKPVYLWWNRTNTQSGEPLGGKRDRLARIYAWQKITCTVAADAATGIPVPMKAAEYAATGDVGSAVSRGAAEARQRYSGQWKAVQQTVLVPVNHQVAPKKEALTCDYCHGGRGLDLTALGYRSR